MVKTLIYLIHLMGIQGQPLSNPTCMKGMMWQIMIWNTMGLLHSEFLSIIQLIKNIYAEIYLYYSMLCSVIVKARMVSSELKKVYHQLFKESTSGIALGWRFPAQNVSVSVTDVHLHAWQSRGHPFFCLEQRQLSQSFAGPV